LEQLEISCFFPRPARWLRAALRSRRRRLGSFRKTPPQFSPLLLGRLSKAHTRSATVLVDELNPDTGGLTLLVPLASSGSALRLDALCNLRLQFPPRQLQIIVGLQVQPELWAVTEVQPKAESRVCCNAPTVVYNLRNPVWRNSNRL